MPFESRTPPSCHKSLTETQIHPVHVTFLNFYAALSHESLARSMHNLSAAKMPALDLAEEFYTKAADALLRPADTVPSPSTSATDTKDSFSQTSPECDSNAASDPASSTRPTSCDSTISTLTTASSTSSMDDASAVQVSSIVPSPLRIRKLAPVFLTSPTAAPTATVPPPLSPSPTSTERHSTTHIQSTPTKANATTATTAQLVLATHANTRYASLLSSFASQLTIHVAALRALRATTAAAQAEPARAASYWSFAPGAGTGTGDAGRAARVAEGRAREWRRERFRAEAYQRLAERALGEL
ncbi:hypothetical protein B0A49_05132 [Cryomyces minteri]|uniref:Uncharacterized protein n=1 Tax=Cryomyces minteri TaxID=331657 RepID=A0A4V5NES4_9PEZI|nr:hypothetical protein B0A49_05132 [Cryomyces minteri]